MAIRIKERSLIAKITSYVLKAKRVAVTIGNTIHLTGVSRQQFLNDQKWLAHEMVHVEQFRKYGFYKFLWLYLKESIGKGYFKNKFEVEARKAEGLENAMDHITI